MTYPRRRELTTRARPRSPGDRGREECAQFPAALQVLLARRAFDAYRRPDRPPLQPGGDRFHPAHRPAGVRGAVYVQPVGPPPGRLQARVVDAVEEVLERAGHVPDVGRGKLGVSTLPERRPLKTLDIYTRGSHKSEKRITPIAGQEKGCRNRIAALGAEVGMVFSDPGKSAWNPAIVRPDWDTLMVRLESGQSDGVVVYDLARFARRPADGERLIAAAENGLTILDSGSEYDLTSASGKKNFRDQMGAAAYYSDIISENSKRGKAMKASLGAVDQRRSFGFESDGVTLNESEAAIIRDHAARLLAGETQDALIKELHERGVSTVNAAQWSYTNYRQVMTRPRNAGFIVHNGEVVPGVRLPGEPILKDEIHYRLVAMYAARKWGRQPSGRYLLSGIVLCPCGSALSGRPYRTNRQQYYCRGCRKTYIDARHLDEWAGDFTVKVLSDPASASAIEQEARELSQKRSALENEAAGIEATLVEIGGRLGRREISLQRHDAICGPLDSRLGEISAELAGLAVAKPSVDLGRRTIPAADKEYGWWLDKWMSDTTTTGERRGMLLTALQGKRPIVGPGRPGQFDPSRVSLA
jgi:site-specific DNA recombinase